MSILIKGGLIVNEGHTTRCNIVVEGERIASVGTVDTPPCDHTIDATGCYVLPGIIDSHVHFREPGLTEKACIETESRAAAAGGVTSYFDMPNTLPQTTSMEALDDKFRRAAQCSHINYSFFFGATSDNAGLFTQLDATRIPGIKLFMGSSTGNMLVDRDEALHRIFSSARLPIMAHCEDTSIIQANMAYFQQRFGDDPDVQLHSLIRSEEACVSSTAKAIALATEHHARLHVAHLSTAEEVAMFPPADTSEGAPLPRITAEATVGHLYFSLTDYVRLGTRIKVNPAIKNFRDCYALRQALNDGRITTIATDHAPHLLSQKEGGCKRAASGMPMTQFALVTMLELTDEQVITIERLVDLMCHNPARLFGVQRRGFLRKGYQADIAIVRPKAPWTLTKDKILSRCAWSPMEGHEFHWRVEQTLCNGHLIYNNGVVTDKPAGQAITFCHEP